MYIYISFLKIFFLIFFLVFGYFLKKSRIRETLNISTDADSSTDTTVRWTKNTQKPKKKLKTEKIIQNGKTQNV